MNLRWLRLLVAVGMCTVFKGAFAMDAAPAQKKTLVATSVRKEMSARLQRACDASGLTVVDVSSIAFDAGSQCVAFGILGILGIRGEKGADWVGQL